MSEVIFGISPEIAQLHMNYRDLSAEEQSEVYEAVGGVLGHLFEIDPEFCIAGDSLVALGSGKYANFSWGIAESARLE